MSVPVEVEAWARRLRGLNRADLGDVEGALADLRDALQRARGHLPPGEVAVIASSLGEVLHTRSRWSEALEIYHHTIEGLVTAGVPIPWQLSLNLGNTLMAVGDLRPATSSFEAALRAMDDGSHPTRTALVLGNLGVAEGRLGNLEAAAEYFERAEEAWEVVGPCAGMANNLANLGKILTMSGSPDEGLANLARAAEVQQHIGLRRDELRTTLMLAEAQSAGGHHADAVRSLLRVVEGAVALDDLHLRAEASAELARRYAVLGDHARAYEAQVQASALSAEVLDRAKVEQIERLKADHEVALRRREAEDLRAANEELQRANARIQDQQSSLELARRSARDATIAHLRFLEAAVDELADPLRQTLIAAELLVASGNLGDGALGVAHHAWESTGRVRALLDLILDHVRLDAGEAPPSADEAFDVADDLWAVLRLVEGREVGLVVKAGTPTRARGASTRLGEVLLTLVRAAAARGDAPISVTVGTAPGECLRVEVLDHGRRPSDAEIGFLPDAGIELARARRIVEALGGRIGLRPAAQGNLCWFTAPVAAAGPPRRADLVMNDDPDSWSGPPHDAAGGATGVVLLVTQESATRGAILRMLGPKHEILLAGDGWQALEVALANPDISWVILDTMMRGLDGYTTARRLREAGCQARIIGLSAVPGAELTRRALSAGMTALLRKPLTREQLDAELPRLR